MLTFRQTQILPRVHLGPTWLLNFSLMLFLWRLIDQVFNLRSDLFWLVEMYALEGPCNFDLVWGREREGLLGYRMYTMTLNWWSFSNFSIGPFAPRNIYPDLTHQIGSENIWHLPESFGVKSVNLCTKYMHKICQNTGYNGYYAMVLRPGNSCLLLTRRPPWLHTKEICGICHHSLYRQKRNMVQLCIDRAKACRILEVEETVEACRLAKPYPSTFFAFCWQVQFSLLLFASLIWTKQWNVFHC